MTEPLPVGGYGKADWVDYSNYWREGDAEWLMERSILRYASAAARLAQWPNPKWGQTSYNEVTDKLEVFSRLANDWGQIHAFVNLVSTDAPAGVSISHKNAGGKGIVFQPTVTLFDNPINVLGVASIDASGLAVKTHATKVAKLTTNATSLVSDSPITAPGISLTGVLTGTSSTLSGTLTVPNISMSGTLSGGTFAGNVTGGVINGTSGVIGGVTLINNSVWTPNGGLISQGAYVYGAADMAYYSFRNPSSGALSASQVTVNSTFIRLRAPNGIPLDRGDGTWTGAWVGGAIVSSTDPGAANFPNGTIWVS